MLQAGDTIAIVGLSDPRTQKDQAQIEELKSFFATMGIDTQVSRFLYCVNDCRLEKAKELECFFKDPTVRVIFDVSGGNLANGILPYLDFDSVRDFYKPFFGYSDLTPILNAIYTKTGKLTYLFQLRTLCWSQKDKQKQRLIHSLCLGKNDLFDPEWQWLNGKQMSGIVVGGNIRCFLKLAGTSFFPDLNEKLLFLESFGGSENLIKTYFYQLQTIGVFEKIKGLLLGTFTQFENEGGDIRSILQEVAPESLPIAKTKQIGHGEDSMAIAIGQYLDLERRDILA